ncbi:MAG: helix-turn-helix transcriptional regulator [Acholeplasma sp.]|nr:helix-turn-helix transcriptional regulator [Acholeplasma sp.]
MKNDFFREELKRLRLKSDLSVEELSEKLGYKSSATVVGVEEGKKPSQAFVNKVCSFFNIKEETLFDPATIEKQVKQVLVKVNPSIFSLFEIVLTGLIIVLFFSVFWIDNNKATDTILIIMMSLSVILAGFFIYKRIINDKRNTFFVDIFDDEEVDYEHQTDDLKVDQYFKYRTFFAGILVVLNILYYGIAVLELSFVDINKVALYAIGIILAIVVISKIVLLVLKDEKKNIDKTGPLMIVFFTEIMMNGVFIKILLAKGFLNKELIVLGVSNLLMYFFLIMINSDFISRYTYVIRDINN